MAQPINLQIEQYKSCFYDIVKRGEIIAEFVYGKKTIGYLIADVEFICIQFRKLLEMIALSSMVANFEEYSKQYAKFATHWKAKQILQSLEQVNKDFYPKPVKLKSSKTIKGRKVMEMEDIKSGFLTKEEFAEIYDNCSEFIHAHNPYSPHKDIKDLIKKFPTWLVKVVTLLNHHHITLYNSTVVLVGVAKNPGSGKPSVHVLGHMEDKDINELYS